MKLSERVEQPERMDTETLSLPVMRETLSFLETTNRLFGGSGVIRRFLRKVSAHWPKHAPIEILDVGTGGGEIPVAMAAWAAEHQWNVRITAIDIVPEIVALARAKTQGWPQIIVEQTDLADLKTTGRMFDYVTASLFLHHMPSESLVLVLKTFDALSRRGFIISDLERSLPSYWSVRILSELIGNDIVRHDGPLSVRRAFTLPELDLLARDAGLPYLKAQREPWFRVSLAGEKM